MKADMDFWAKGMPASMGRTGVAGRLEQWSHGTPFRIVIPVLEFGEKVQSVSSTPGLASASATKRRAICAG